MFSLAISVWEILLRTIAVYVVVLLGLRAAGKRELGQMSVFDLVLLLLIANAVQNAMVAEDNSLLGGLLAALALLLLNSVIARFTVRFPRLRRVLQGSPTILVLHGEIIEEHLRREGIDLETLEAASREHGVNDIKEVEMAVLETDGTVSIIPNSHHTRRTRRVRKPL